MYRTVDYTFKTGVENSSECVTKIIQELRCQNKCFYISGSSLPICNSTTDFLGCFWAHYTQWQECLLQKHAVAYVPQKDEEPIYGNNVTQLQISSEASKTKQIMEEIDVITLSGLIGSIGGSLGMFFGFSITSYISFVIEKLTKKGFKKCSQNIS